MKFRVLAWLFLLATGAVPQAWAEALPGGTLDPTTIPKYVTPLVIPPVMNDTGTADDYRIAVRQFQQQILPGGIWNTINGRDGRVSADDRLELRPEYGSGARFYGPRRWCRSGAGSELPVQLPGLHDRDDGQSPGQGPVDQRPGRQDDRAGSCRHLLPIDQTLHWANPPIDSASMELAHGRTADGFTRPLHRAGADRDPRARRARESHSDGYPEAWWLPAAINIPAGYATKGSVLR